MDAPFPQRKNPRLQGYDYAQGGMYFVTICTHQRQHRFGRIENDTMHLNAIGQIAWACWQEIPVHYACVELDVAVVMPNHVHGIVMINNGTDVSTAAGMYPRPTDSNDVSTDSNKSVSLSTIMGSYKAAVTRIVRRQFPQTETLWQTSYHDHIIRNEKSLNFIRHYVINNPASWAKDTLF